MDKVRGMYVYVIGNVKRPILGDVVRSARFVRSNGRWEKECILDVE